MTGAASRQARSPAAPAATGSRLWTAPAAPAWEDPGSRTQPWLRDLERFIRVNQLTPGGQAVIALRQLDQRSARVVMGTEGSANGFELSGAVRNQDAVVMTRINRLRTTGRAWKAPPRAG